MPALSPPKRVKSPKRRSQRIKNKSQPEDDSDTDLEETRSTQTPSPTRKSPRKKSRHKLETQLVKVFWCSIQYLYRSEEKEDL